MRATTTPSTTTRLHADGAELRGRRRRLLTEGSSGRRAHEPRPDRARNPRRRRTAPERSVDDDAAQRLRRLDHGSVSGTSRQGAAAAATRRNAADERLEARRSLPCARAHGTEEQAATRRDARADRASRLTAERDVDIAGDDARVGAADHVPGERTRELVVDAPGGHDDPRARDRKADAQAVTFARGEGGTGRERAEHEPADAEENGHVPSHSGRRVQTSERPEATRRSTTPAPAKAAVTSRSSRLVPSRLPRSR